jgi:glycosyltransferase involved in cell wall biosynthesis
MISLTQEDVMRSWGGTYDHPLLSIACITFNHEKYIHDTLDAFLTQKTNFPFEIIIHDDCSNDETAKIIREYEIKFPKIIKPIFQSENQYSKGTRAILATFVYPKCSGKYIALCEGDDYWIDENKLQKQVDFLEANPDYGLCYTKIKSFYQDTQSFLPGFIGGPVSTFEDYLINGNQKRTTTLTYVMRKSLCDQYVKEINPSEQHWLLGDYPLTLFLLKYSKAKYFDEVTAVYRVLSESASHSVNPEKILKLNRCLNDIQLFFAEKYNVQGVIKITDRELYSGMFFNAVANATKDNTKEKREVIVQIYKNLDKPTKKEKIFMSFCKTVLGIALLRAYHNVKVFFVE